MFYSVGNRRKDGNYILVLDSTGFFVLNGAVTNI